MSTHTRISGPVRTAMFSFLTLSGIAAGLAIAKGRHALDAATADRAVGMVIGVMVIFTGNLLPKMRPINASTESRGQAARAERLAGWILLVLGIAYTSLFVFAPLDQARHVSALIGLGAIAVIAVSFAWPTRGGLFAPRQVTGGTAPLSERRKLAVWLLFAMVYVFAATSVAFLFGHGREGNAAASWMLIGFTLACAVLQVVLGAKRSPD